MVTIFARVDYDVECDAQKIYQTYTPKPANVGKLKREDCFVDAGMSHRSLLIIGSLLAIDSYHFAANFDFMSRVGILNALFKH